MPNVCVIFFGIFVVLNIGRARGRASRMDVAIGANSQKIRSSLLRRTKNSSNDFKRGEKSKRQPIRSTATRFLETLGSEFGAKCGWDSCVDLDRRGGRDSTNE